ncbi:MAG: glycosyltransferase family 2 protein [Cyanobacteriota bacterium]|nr:glycosyltransferase family 2 protein [Cyanobacteriota bacterium]
MEVKELAVIILNYRTPQLTIDCLRSLAPEINGQTHRVVVVDNASGDGSPDVIETAITQEKWQDWATLLVSPVNGGFAAGNNLGIQSTPARAYWLLNSDTLIRPQALTRLLTALYSQPRIGLVSPRLEWPDETPQISCFRFPSPASELINGAATSFVTRLFQSADVPLAVQPEPSFPQWTSFASVMIRQEVFEEIGLLDDGYFMYYEDVDFCRRAAQAGWQILNFPEARVVHLRGGSGSTKKDLAARRRPKAFLYESRARYFAKFYGRGGLGLANVAWLSGRSLAYLREKLGNKAPHTCLEQERDIWINWSAPLGPSSFKP